MAATIIPGQSGTYRHLRDRVTGLLTETGQTFLVAGTFASEVEAERYAAYLRTKFVRFLVHQRKVSQHTTSDSYLFVPDIPMDREWTDAALYKRYQLTDEEIAYVESQIKPMDATDVIEDPANGDDEDSE